jgi:hypothetical protein
VRNFRIGWQEFGRRFLRRMNKSLNLDGHSAAINWAKALFLQDFAK